MTFDTLALDSFRSLSDELLAPSPTAPIVLERKDSYDTAASRAISGGVAASGALPAKFAQLALFADAFLVTKLRRMLILHRGQLLQISKQHPDGWAFGSVCYDEQCPDGRPPSGTEGFSTYSGWFPLERTVSFGLTLIREPTKEPARPTLTRY